MQNATWRLVAPRCHHGRLRHPVATFGQLASPVATPDLAWDGVSGTVRSTTQARQVAVGVCVQVVDEVLKSKQDHLAAIPFENVTMESADSTTGPGIATPPLIHSVGCV